MQLLFENECRKFASLLEIAQKETPAETRNVPSHTLYRIQEELIVRRRPRDSQRRASALVVIVATPFLEREVLLRESYPVFLEWL